MKTRASKSCRIPRRSAATERRRRLNAGCGVPANCGSVSPERSEPRSGRYAGCEQVGRRPHHRAARRFEQLKPKHAPPLPRHRYTSDGAAMPKPSRCYFTSSIAIFPPKRLRLTLSCLDFSFLVFSYALIMPKNSPSALTCRPQKRYNFIHFFGGTTCLKICRVSWRR